MVLPPLPVDLFSKDGTLYEVIYSIASGLIFGSGVFFCYIYPPSHVFEILRMFLKELLGQFSVPSNAKIIVGHRSDFEADKRHPDMEANTLSGT